MNLALLWIDALLITLLWVTGAAAFLGRINRKWVRWPLSWIAVAVPFVVLGGFLASTVVIRRTLEIGNALFHYVGGLIIGFVVGTILILWRASRRTADSRPAAVSWRRGPLVLGWLVTIVIGYMTITNMDLTLRARCALLSTQLNTLYIAMSPAIVSDSQNAATLYEQAFQRLKDDSHEQDVQNPPTGNNETFDPNEPATIAFLSRHTRTLALLREAAAMPGCRFEQDVKDLNVTMDLSGLNECRNAANVLALDAREEIARGNAAPAIADCAAILGMSRHIGRRPLLVASLVGIGIDAIGNKTLEAALPIVNRPEDLNALHLESLQPFGRAFQQSLWGEERFGLMYYSSMPNNPGAAPKIVADNSQLMASAGIGGSLFRIFFLDLDAYVKLMNNLQNSAVKPYFQVRNHLVYAEGANPHSDILTAIIAPSFNRSFETAARTQAIDVCASTAVAMTKFKLDHGAFPDHLDALVPNYMESVPVDPCDGKPLRLLVNKDRRIIYSVGPDGVDDGGIEGTHGGKGDIVFTLKSAADKHR